MSSEHRPPPSEREMEAMLDRYLLEAINQAAKHSPKPLFRSDTLPTVQAPSIAPKP
jgi:hypothetical protein